MCGPTSTKTTTIAPTVASGFARRRNVIAASLVGLTIFYNLVQWAFSGSSMWLRPANEYCKDSDVDETGRCSRPDLFAFQAASAVMQLYMGGMGLWAWHITKRTFTRIPQTPEGRLFGYLEEADRLNAGIFVYQTFDFFASMVVPEHNTWVFLGHHLLTAITAWMSLEHQMVHYYAVFFGGCSEISTIFLVLCDFDVYFPAERGSTWGTVIAVCQACFVVTFFYYRVVGWWAVSYNLWSDVLAVHNKGTIEAHRPGKSWFLYAFLLMDFLLGSLQVYWFGFGILPKILEILNDE